VPIRKAKRTTAPDGISGVIAERDERPVKRRVPPELRITPGRAARVAVELAHARRRLHHRPTREQLRVKHPRRMASHSRVSVVRVSGILSAMRTTLDIADGLIEALMARYPEASKTEAIEIAIAAHLSEDAAVWLRAQAGTVSFDETAWLQAREAERSRAAERIAQFSP
jgi:hypothetical protein